MYCPAEQGGDREELIDAPRKKDVTRRTRTNAMKDNGEDIRRSSWLKSDGDEVVNDSNRFFGIGQ